MLLIAVRQATLNDLSTVLGVLSEVDLQRFSVE